MNITTNIDEKREAFKNILRQGVAEVEFIKINGEHRVMPCTLNADLIPTPPVKVLKEGEVPKAPKAENPEVIRAFCTDKQEWRSFRIDSVISIKLT